MRRALGADLYISEHARGRMQWGDAVPVWGLPPLEQKSEFFDKTSEFLGKSYETVACTQKIICFIQKFKCPILA